MTNKIKAKFLSFIFVFAVFFGNAQLTTLLNFNDTNGSYPQNSLYYDGTFLYGTTYWGGASDSGLLFKIKPDGTGYTSLIDFNGSNGSYPWGAVFYDGTFLYGMTERGGANHLGTIFKIMPNGTGYTKLLDFSGVSNGAIPRGSLISDGVFLYGMTFAGGINDSGTIFKIMPDGSGYVKLLDFDGVVYGKYPTGSSLFYDGTFLYGTTEVGGVNHIGTIFKIMPDGSGYSKLLDFNGITNGSYPWSTFFYDGTFLYGTTKWGGTNNVGTIYKIKTDGSGYITLRDFSGADGNTINSSLISDGTFLYATAFMGGVNNKGNIFKLKYDGSGFTNLFDFTAFPCGNYPLGSLISDGIYLYGMTNGGGTYGEGTVYKFQYGTVGINNSTNSEVKIFPNPAKDLFVIETGSFEDYNLEIVDISGKLLLSKTIKGMGDLNVSEFKDGIYNIIISSSTGIINRKLAIIR